MIDMLFMLLQAYISRHHEGDKVIVFERGGVIFVFNFNKDTSFTDYQIGINDPGKYPLKI